MLRPVLIRIWIVTAVFVAIGVARSVAVGIPFRDPGNKLFLDRIALTLGIFVALVAVETLARSRKGERSPAQLWAGLRRRWTWGRLAVAWTALMAYFVVYVVYRNLKSWDVLNTPRDGGLTRVDEWIFLGHSPAVLLHDLLGTQTAAHLLIRDYEFFPTVVSIAVPAFVVFPRVLGGLSAIASMIWIWILGTATYYLIPSLGPFAERPQDFAGLAETKATRNQALYLEQRLHLLAHPSAHDAFASVSAFASLHVGVTTVVTLMVARLGYRRLAWFMRAFLVVTIVATIYLGWHFFVDIPAGLFIGWASVRLGVWMSGGHTEDVADATGAPEHERPLHA